MHHRKAATEERGAIKYCFNFSSLADINLQGQISSQEIRKQIRYLIIFVDKLFGFLELVPSPVPMMNAPRVRAHRGIANLSGICICNRSAFIKSPLAIGCGEVQLKIPSTVGMRSDPFYCVCEVALMKPADKLPTITQFCNTRPRKVYQPRHGAILFSEDNAGSQHYFSCGG